MKYRIIIFFAFLISFASCDRSEPDMIETYVESIQVQPFFENVLRKNIEVRFKQDSRYLIEYWNVDKGPRLSTGELSASGGSSSTATLIFLEPSARYEFKIRILDGAGITESRIYEFTTSALPPNVPVCTVSIDELTDEIDGYIMTMQKELPGYVTILDTKGSVVWYENYSEPVWVVDFDPRFQTLSCITGRHPDRPYTGNKIIVRDLYGNLLLKRDAKDLYPHHDIKRLEDGNLIFVNYVPRKFDLSHMGGTTDETVWGDGYTVMDANGSVIKRWDCFGEVDPTLDPRIMEPIGATAASRVPLLYKDDWLHANSVNLDSQGNIYMTFNWDSELWKISHSTDKVEYRIGDKGNLSIPKEACTSGIHSCIPLDEDRILVFDNGIRTQNSRALIYKVADSHVSLDLEVSLPIRYSSAFMGNVEIIHDTLLMFGSTLSNSTIFTDMEGNIKRVLLSSQQSYRSVFIASDKLKTHRNN